MTKLKTGSDFSGVGALDQALSRMGISQDKQFACDMDKYVRRTYLENYGTTEDLLILETNECKFIDDVYYRGLVDTKLKPPTQQEWDQVFAIEEAVARSFSFYYPWNVYSRKIPTDPLDLYFPTPPCQAFSLAGKRQGEEDKRGILFYNSHEFIVKNKPRMFGFENVKGLVSHDKGRTFQRWIDLLAGKSVNGTDKAFPHEESVPYHVYYKVMNAKHYGVPQNRERIIIIGIRDDEDNGYQFAKSEHLKKSLRDCLEEKVDKKYFLSDKMLSGFLKHADRHNERGNGFAFEPNDLDKPARAITTASGSRHTDNYIETPDLRTVGHLYENKSDAGRVYDPDGISCTLKAEGGGGGAKTGLYLMSEEEVIGGAIRGRYDADGKAKQTLELNTTGCSNALTTVEKDNVLVVKFERTEEAKDKRRKSISLTGKDTSNFSERQITAKPQEFPDTIIASPNRQKDGLIAVSEETVETDNGLYRITCGCGHNFVGTLRDSCPGCNEIRDGYTNEITDEVVQLNESKESGGKQPYQHNRIYADHGVSCALDTEAGRRSIYTKYRVRRLTPRECFRLMDFPDSFSWTCSDSQAYKQAGNSIPVAMIVAALSKIKFLKSFINEHKH